MHWLLIRQFFSLFAQFKTTTKSHENYVFLYSFSSMAIYPPKIMKKLYFILVNCIGWQVWYNYVALFSDLKKTVVTCDWTNDCSLFLALFEYPQKWCTCGVIWLLRGWCHVKLLPSRRTFCVHYTTRHQFTVSLHSKPLRQGECVFSCNLHCRLHVWHNDQDLLHATAVTRGWNGYQNKSQNRKVDHRVENSHSAPPGTRTRDLLITCPALYHWAIPAP